MNHTQAPKKQTQTNPIQTQSKPVLSAVEWANLRKAKMNVSFTLTKDYRKKDDFIVRINKANSNPISKMPKMNVNLYVIEDYENEPPSGPKKQTQFKPNFFKGQNERKIACRKIWPHPL